jgi:hypothetical protein
LLKDRVLASISSLKKDRTGIRKAEMQIGNKIGRVM